MCGVGWGELWGLFNLDEISLFWLIYIIILVALALFRALAFHEARVTADMLEMAEISRDYFLGSLLTSGGGRRSTPLPTQLSRLRKGGSGEKRKTDFT